MRIADRRAGDHPQWLACAAAVLDGAADDAALARVAEEIVPFVAGDVAGDWVAAMTSVTDEMAAAYREAVGAMADRPAVRFEVPSGMVRRAAPLDTTRPPPPAPAAAAPAMAPVPSDPVGVPPGAPAPDFTGVPGAAFDQGVFDPEVKQPADAFEKPDAAEPEPKPEVEPDSQPESQPEPEPEPEPAPPLPEPTPPAEPLPAEAGFAAEPEAAPPTPCEAAAAALPQLGE